MSRKILVLFAHPSLHRSEVNRKMLGQVDDLASVTLVDLYGEYLWVANSYFITNIRRLAIATFSRRYYSQAA